MRPIFSKIILTLLFIGGLVALFYLRGLVVNVLLSIVLTIILMPLTERLEKVQIRGWYLPSWLIALLSLMVFFGSIFGILSIISPLLASEIRSISSIDTEDLYIVFNEPLGKLEGWLHLNDIQFDNELSNREYIKAKILKRFNIEQISSIFSGFLGGVGTFLYTCFIVLFITFFLLKDHKKIRVGIGNLLPQGRVNQALQVFINVEKTLSRYLIGLLIEVTMVALLVSIGLGLLGVKNALVIGILAGMLNVIPYLGPLIGALLGLLIVMTTNLDMMADNMVGTVFGTLGVFAFTQITDNVVFQPLIYGRSVDAQPLEIFLVIMIAGSLGGVLGMIAAVPTYSIIRIIAREFFPNNPIVRILNEFSN